MSRCRRPAARCSGDSGAIIIEGALLSPLIMFFILAILDGSLAFMSSLTVANTSRLAARTASVSANDGIADYNILQAVKSASGAVDSDRIQRIVVYKGSGIGSTVPTACKTATVGVTNSCNVYTVADLSKPSNSTTFGCGTLAKDKYWCPTTRKSALTGTNGPPDWIGVYVEFEHDYVTGLFGSDVILTGDSALRIEAGSLS